MYFIPPFVAIYAHFVRQIGTMCTLWSASEQFIVYFDKRLPWAQLWCYSEQLGVLRHAYALSACPLEKMGCLRSLERLLTSNSHANTEDVPKFMIMVSWVNLIICTCVCVMTDWVTFYIQSFQWLRFGSPSQCETSIDWEIGNLKHFLPPLSFKINDVTGCSCVSCKVTVKSHA